jgi:transposase-like protein
MDTHDTRRPIRQSAAKAAREQFLAHLRTGMPVLTAAALVGVGRKTVYRWREGSLEFRQAWDEAYASGSDAVEEVARRRAMDGWLEPVFQGGVEVGDIRRYSDRLLDRLLRARKPEMFGERLTLAGTVRTGPPDDTRIEIVYVSQNCPHGPDCPQCAREGRTVRQVIPEKRPGVPDFSAIEGNGEGDPGKLTP